MCTNYATRWLYYRNYPTCEELPVPPPRRHCYGGRGRTAYLLALVGELAGASSPTTGGRMLMKRLLARRDRHPLEHVMFVQRVERVVSAELRVG